MLVYLWLGFYLHDALFFPFRKNFNQFIMLVVLTLTVSQVNYAAAQEAEVNVPDPELIVNGIAPVALRWSDQELKLAFLNATIFGRGLTLENDEWYLFDIESKDLSQSNIWTLQPPIPAHLDTSVKQNSPIFLSPDGRYLVYSPPSTEELDAEGGSLIQIYDIQSHTPLGTHVRSGRSSGVIGSFDVIWGGYEAFVARTAPVYGGEPSFPIFNYVALNNLASDQLLSVFEFSNRIFVVSDVFDVSSNGLRVLMAGGFLGEDNAFLAVWDAQSPNELIFIPETRIDVVSILDAHFTTFDGTEFVFFNNQGIGCYNVSTETLEIIEDQVTAQSYREARFSPGVQALALASDTGVYWLDLGRGE